MPWREVGEHKVRDSSGWKNITLIPTTSGGGGSGGGGTTTDFLHESVVISKAQLDFTRDKLATNTEPWYGRYNNMLTITSGSGANLGRAYSSLDWVPTPWVEVGRGSSGDPSQGDKDLTNDSKSALAHALIWRYKGTRASASKSAQIMNAWSSTITKILYSYPTPDWSDGKLLSGWVGTIFARAAEIIRHSGYVAGAGETALDVTGFENMLKNVFVPLIKDPHSGAGGNWHASFADSMIQIGVFCNDRAIFNSGVDFFKGNLPATMWLLGDQNSWTQLRTSTPPSSGLPISAPGTMYDKSTTSASSMRTYWHNPTSWPTGLTIETGRDMHHTAMSFAAFANGAETAWHNGIDLYDQFQTRITTAMEYFTDLVYRAFVGGNYGTGALPPSGFPFASTQWKMFATSFQRATFETLYNHYAVRKGISLPKTLQYLNNYTRISNWDSDLHAFCEELVHRGTP